MGLDRDAGVRPDAEDPVIPGLTRDLRRNRAVERLEIPAFAGMTLVEIVETWCATETHG